MFIGRGANVGVFLGYWECDMSDENFKLTRVIDIQ